MFSQILTISGSNNTNKLSPQEQEICLKHGLKSSNNTNKLSPQELMMKD